MRRAARSLAALAALVLPAAAADSAVWRVTHDGASVYLGGTVHKLSPEQYPLPAEYQAAYERSGIIVFETDIGAMGNPEVQSRIAARSLLPEGQTLSGVLNPSTHAALQEYCAELGFPAAFLETLQPAAALLTLLGLTLQSAGITAPGVDEHFFQRASTEAKDVRALETVDQQIDFLMSLDQGDPDGLVDRAIEDLREVRDGALRESFQVWRDGNEAAMIEHFLREQMLYSPELYQSLMVERNRAWMGALRQYLQTAETELVLVGVAHMVGEDGLISMLESEGYHVERFSAP